MTRQLHKPIILNHRILTIINHQIQVKRQMGAFIEKTSIANHVVYASQFPMDNSKTTLMQMNL